MATSRVYDIKGYPIYPGDLIRTFHYRGPRKRINYLYHTAIQNEKHHVLELVPTAHLEPTKANSGGRCWLSQDVIDRSEGEIIQGYGPDSAMSFQDRPKRVLTLDTASA